MSKTVTIEFDDDKVAEGFIGWMCNSGEQIYWQDQEDNDEPMANFKYDFKTLEVKAPTMDMEEE